MFLILTVTEINEGSEPFQKLCACVCVSKRVWKREWNWFLQSPPPQSSGHCVFKVHVSLLSDNVLLLSYWRSLFHDQSTNRKGQGCDSCIPLTILPPSMHLILTQKDSANIFPQIRARVCKQACPSYAVTKQGTLCFVGGHSEYSLHNTF